MSLPRTRTAASNHPRKKSTAGWMTTPSSNVADAVDADAIPAEVRESLANNADAGNANWVDRAAALSRPEGAWLLSKLVNVHAMTFVEFEDEQLGAFGAVALGQLMRAHYVVEGEARLHATDLGRAAFAEFLRDHPEVANQIADDES